MQKIKDTQTNKYYLLPTDPEELTFEDFVKACRWQQQGGTIFDLVASLAGMPEGLAFDLAEVWKGFDKNKMIRYLIGLAEPKNIKAFSVDRYGKPLKVKDFEQLTMQQRLLMIEAVKDYKYTFEALPEILAIAIAPQLSEDWVADIDSVKTDVLGMRASIAVPTAYFFLRALTPSRGFGLTSSFQKTQYSVRLAVRRWGKSLGFGLPQSLLAKILGAGKK